MSLERPRHPAVLAVLALSLFACARKTALPSSAEPLEVVNFLRQEATHGFARVQKPRSFEFPADHGPHADHQLEWWYFTGNLAGPMEERYGFQLTIFRHGHEAVPRLRTSAWAASSSWMAHFAITDARGNSFDAKDRFARGAAGLAGGGAEPFRVWLEDWEARGSDAFLPLRLTASTDRVAIDLELDSEKPLVLHGERGFSKKGAVLGEASHYHSYTRLFTKGRLKIAGREVSVSGLSWMDHEWSTGGLGQDLVGWDWFALQLDDGRELMIYSLRSKGGGAALNSEGTLVDARGLTRRLLPGDFEVRSVSTWTSAESGATYPAAWEVVIPSAALNLKVTPLIANQELNLTFRYWEGAVIACGAEGDLVGRGYVELVGYPAPAQKGAIRIR